MSEIEHSATRKEDSAVGCVDIQLFDNNMYMCFMYTRICMYNVYVYSTYT